MCLNLQLKVCFPRGVFTHYARYPLSLCRTKSSRVLQGFPFLLAYVSAFLAIPGLRFASLGNTNDKIAERCPDPKLDE